MNGKQGVGIVVLIGVIAVSAIGVGVYIHKGRKRAELPPSFYRKETGESYTEDFTLVREPHQPEVWPDWAPKLVRGSYEDGKIIAKGEKYPVWIGKFRVKEDTTTAGYVKGSLEDAWMKRLVIEGVYYLSKFKADTFYMPHPGPAPEPGENVAPKPLGSTGRTLNLEVSKYLFKPEETTKPSKKVSTIQLENADIDVSKLENDDVLVGASVRTINLNEFDVFVGCLTLGFTALENRPIGETHGLFLDPVSGEYAKVREGSSSKISFVRRVSSDNVGFYNLNAGNHKVFLHAYASREPLRHNGAPLSKSDIVKAIPDRIYSVSIT